MATSSGPILKGTKADAVKFHDDKSLYTGVYARGGPTNVEKDKISDISSLCDRSDADVRGTKVQQSVVNEITNKTYCVEESKVQKKQSVQKVTSAEADSPKSLFLAFTQGAKDMDGKVFAKMCKDCKVISKLCSTTDVDLIFAAVKDKGVRKIDYTQFLKAIEQCAYKRKETSDELFSSMMKVGGPVFTATKVDAVKFHDDKSLHTGAYSRGGPTTVGGTGGISDISQLCDRTQADVRGVKL